MAAHMKLAKCDINTFCEIRVYLFIEEASKYYCQNDVHVDKEAEHGREPQ
jgi:hypothetical protein